MKYTVCTDPTFDFKSITLGNTSIPIDPANQHYQECLDALIEQGADCFDGEVPQDILNAAAEKLFNTQADAYRAAKARLAQYQLSVGRPQVTEMQATGKQAMNEETHEMQDVLEEVVVQPAIEPLEATVEITVYNEDDPLAEPTKSVVTNPLIVKDDAQRTKAQEVIDSTPTQVKERVDNE